MMKKFTRILSLALVLATLLVFLVSCDMSESVKKSFTEAGYNVNTVGSEDKIVKSALLLKYTEEELKAMKRQQKAAEKAQKAALKEVPKYRSLHYIDEDDYDELPEIKSQDSGKKQIASTDVPEIKD